MSIATSASLRQCLSIAFRDRRRIALGFFLPMALASVLAFIPKKKYEATASLLVRPGREYVYRPEVGENSAQPISFDLDHSVASELQILTSRPVEEKALAAVGVARLYPDIAAGKGDVDLSVDDLALLQLQRKLDALVVKDSAVLQVSFQHRDRYLAAELLNRLVEAYLVHRREIMAEARTAFEESQVEDARKKLAAQEARLEEFKRRHDIVSFDDQRRLLLEQRAALDEKLKDAHVSAGAAAGKLARLTGQSIRPYDEVELYAETTRDDPTDSATETLFELKLQREEAVARYSAESSAVAEIDRKIERAQGALQELQAKRQNVVRRGRSPVRDSIETEAVRVRADLGGATTSKNILARQLASVTKELEALSARERELTVLLRDEALLQQTYQSYVKKLQESHIAEDLDQHAKTNVTLIQPALPPIEKKSLRWVILGVGLVISLAFALSVAFFSEFLRDRYISPDEVPGSLGIPLLAWFPDVGATRASRSSRRPAAVEGLPA
jgi:uncharacterized protein involved in exopolysaccharide biosynthesis